MSLALIVPFVLGALAVLQAGLNRRVAAEWGLAGAVFLNTLVVAVIAVGWFAITRSMKGPAVEWFALRQGRSIAWWYVLPGACGVALVVGLPWAIGRIGALQAFIAVVAAQMLAGLAWDYFVEHIQIGGARVGGALLAILGALLVGLK